MNMLLIPAVAHKPLFPSAGNGMSIYSHTQAFDCCVRYDLKVKPSPPFIPCKSVDLRANPRVSHSISSPVTSVMADYKSIPQSLNAFLNFSPQ